MRHGIDSIEVGQGVRSGSLLMAREFIDISTHLENDVNTCSPPFSSKIAYMGHRDAVGQFTGFFPGLKLDFVTVRTDKWSRRMTLNRSCTGWATC